MNLCWRLIIGHVYVTRAFVPPSRAIVNPRSQPTPNPGEIWNLKKLHMWGNHSIDCNHKLMWYILCRHRQLFWRVTRSLPNTKKHREYKVNNNHKRLVQWTYANCLMQSMHMATSRIFVRQVNTNALIAVLYINSIKKQKCLSPYTLHLASPSCVPKTR